MRHSTSEAHHNDYHDGTISHFSGYTYPISRTMIIRRLFRVFQPWRASLPKHMKFSSHEFGVFQTLVASSMEITRYLWHKLYAHQGTYFVHIFRQLRLISIIFDASAKWRESTGDGKRKASTVYRIINTPWWCIYFATMPCNAEIGVLTKVSNNFKWQIAVAAILLRFRH